jgi:hypothetical protein
MWYGDKETLYKIVDSAGGRVKATVGTRARSVAQGLGKRIIWLQERKRIC